MRHSILAKRIALAAGAAVCLATTACATGLPALPGRGETTVMELPASAAPTYADLVTFALAADLVAVVNIDDQTNFPVERAMDVAPGRARVYIQSLTRNLLVSPTGVGGSLTFVTDVDRKADGDVPDLEGRDYLIFADLVPGRPGEVQLVSTGAFVPSGPVIEDRARRVLRQLAASDVPPAVTGVRDVISVEGNLAGESETQMFVETTSGAPVSLSVVRRPGITPQWGVSLGEIVDSTARPPESETLTWYRLACGLPRELPQDSYLQGDSGSRARAREDYAFVLSQLGPCERRFT
ncbi:MAG: hypothetical protein WBA68_06080 [Alteraurantiacibacter sp.]